ncbi:MAG TPA: hypothetical protein VHT91_25775 [Kofleriaceae bacterium]|jgi:hypothetical protein|nr:hypothetical protein [Kofleriaceae bacterium]
MFKNLLLMCFVVSVCMRTAGCVAPEAGNQDPASTTPGPATGLVKPDVVKPTPVRPALAPGVTTGDALPPKPAYRLSTPIAADGFSWSVTMVASPTILWPTSYSIVEVSANADVGPTPYYLRIFYWDGPNRVNVASCATGTSCAGVVTQPDVSGIEFWGAVEDFAQVAQASRSTFIEWLGAVTALSASSPTTSVGASVTLTATSDRDIGPSPFYAEIFDVTTGTLLTECGVGTSCSAQVSQSQATTHAYQAFLSGFGTSLPPPGILEATSISYVTWGTQGWSVDLTADPSPPVIATVTATASADVGPTPYYIEIFDENGTLIKLCGSGTTCTTQYAPSMSGSNLVAFVAPWSTTLVPAGAQASSATVTSTAQTPF